MKKLYIGKPTKENVLKYCNRFSVPLQFLGCCLIYFFIEAMSRHSMREAWAYLVESPLIYLYNTLIIFTTSLIVYLFKRRILARLVVSSFWLILGGINGFILMNRVTPFTGPDVRMVSDALKIMNKYMSPSMIVVAGILLLLLLAFFVWMFRKGWKFQGKLRYWLNIPLVIVGVIAFAGATKMAQDSRLLSSYFGNLAYAYQDYGFPYCLGVTLFDTGISEPNGYSEDLMEEIYRSSVPMKATNPENLDVNILFLQLETFVDPTEINFLKFSQDPVPNFHQLEKEYSSGYYKVPALGAGTANTEFESITGMSLRYFGAGEYPYKTILKESTCESAPYVLKKLGYTAHAIHNNEANFYGRRGVFSKLGFDTFTSEEYMPDISDTTPMGWVKDHILTDEIVKAMESTEGPDYVYTISVQGHGDYPEEPLLSDPVIKVSGAESEGRNNAWEYYVNEMYEMDLFVKELTDRLSEFDEPIVLVMYGDHLPTMNLKVEDMKNKYLFQTKYVMWDNFGMKKQDKNLAAYQMMAEVLNRLDIHEGNVFNYHMNRKGTKNYQLDLQALQYDLLYGKKYIYQGVNPFEATKLQLGMYPPVMDSIEDIGDEGYLVHGDHFTASARLEINKELQETKYINEQVLWVKEAELNPGDMVDVAIQSNSSTQKVLSRTEPEVYQPGPVEAQPEMPGTEKTDVPDGEAAMEVVPDTEGTGDMGMVQEDIVESEKNESGTSDGE